MNTAGGPVDASALGQTLTHEHVNIRTPGVRENWPERSNREAARTNAISRINAAKALGIRSFVDLTTADMGRDPELLREVQAITGVNIVVATGIYWMVPRYWHGRDADDLAKAFIADFEQGIQGTGVKPGAIKLATDQGAGGMDEVNEKCLRAGARAHRATGLPILTHNGPPASAADQQRIFKDEGVDLSHVAVGHVGDTADVGFLKSLMDGGGVIALDRFGMDPILSFDERVNTLVKLCGDGYADRIVLAHDSCCGIDWAPDISQMATRMPNWHMAHISEKVLPALLERGVSEAQIEELMVANPGRLLDPAKPY
ncbi:MAG: phosphotriesterase-related protein [Chloroflexi bacterium]|nr:phosphotriesterase-related protein [Chloroflexota bacterium]